jgi:hypothetical protein
MLIPVSSQIWLEAVWADTTVIILHSGNHEIIGVRERSSQTLYLSKVIEPSKCRDPPYGKLHAGLYIASVKDGIDRSSQIQAASDNPETVGGPSRFGGSEGEKSRQWDGSESGESNEDQDQDGSFTIYRRNRGEVVTSTPGDKYPRGYDNYDLKDNVYFEQVREHSFLVPSGALC